MLRPSSPRLLLLLPTVTYRTVAFVEAARRLGAELTVASERPSTFERANPTGLVTLDFADPTHAAAQAREFARAHPVHGVVAVDDDTAVVAAAIAGRSGSAGTPWPRPPRRATSTSSDSCSPPPVWPFLGSSSSRSRRTRRRSRAASRTPAC